MVTWIRNRLFMASIALIFGCGFLISEIVSGLPVVPASVLEEVYPGTVTKDVYSPGSDSAVLPDPPPVSPSGRMGALPDTGF